MHCYMAAYKWPFYDYTLLAWWLVGAEPLYLKITTKVKNRKKIMKIIWSRDRLSEFTKFVLRRAWLYPGPQRKSSRRSRLPRWLDFMSFSQLIFRLHHHCSYLSKRRNHRTNRPQHSRNTTIHAKVVYSYLILCPIFIVFYYLLLHHMVALHKHIYLYIYNLYIYI